MGRPAVFLRLAGCVPPFCSWCDTPQALGPGRRMGEEQIVERVLSLKSGLVVITGGEPFVQWDAGLSRVANRLARAGRDIQYETSGKAGIPESSGGVVVCSPKPAADPRLAPADAARVHAFKFVVREDLSPVLSFIQRHEMEADRIWLMALGATRAEQQRRMPRVWEMCVEHGFNFSPRLHILAFDDRQGV